MNKASELPINFLTKFNLLPDELKMQVIEFAESLLVKKEQEKKSSKRPFGTAKGKIIIKSGFEDPIDDFKDYL